MSDPSMTAEAWRAVTSDLIEWLRPRYSRHKIAVLESFVEDGFQVSPECSAAVTSHIQNQQSQISHRGAADAR